DPSASSTKPNPFSGLYHLTTAWTGGPEGASNLLGARSRCRSEARMAGCHVETNFSPPSSSFASRVELGIPTADAGVWIMPTWRDAPPSVRSICDPDQSCCREPVTARTVAFFIADVDRAELGEITLSPPPKAGAQRTCFVYRCKPHLLHRGALHRLCGIR